MTHLIKAAALLFCLLLPLPTLAAAAPDAVLDAAAEFTSLIDAGSFQAAYLTSSPLMQQATDEDLWLAKVGRTFDVLGPVQERTLQAARQVNIGAGLPDGRYWLLLYDVETAKKSSAAEVLRLGLVEESWRVVSYDMK